MPLVQLKFKQVLADSGARLQSVYFITAGVVSDVTILDDGKNIEVATIGNEGFVGLTALVGSTHSTSRLIVQVPGEARRMDIDTFFAETKPNAPLRDVLARYHGAYLRQISQAVACNGLHSVHQRCCRWLLMTHDRVQGDEFPMTHEFLSHMLGVRRVTVTEVLKPFQEKGLIRGDRGRIVILDRAGLEAESCQCYRDLEKEFDRALKRL